MDHAKFIVSKQKEDSTNTQTVKVSTTAAKCYIIWPNRSFRNREPTKFENPTIAEKYQFSKSIYLQVANLFARDEMDEILGELIPVMKKEFPRRPPSNENLYDYYLTRVRNNLHVVLCFSPVSYVASEGF